MRVFASILTSTLIAVVLLAPSDAQALNVTDSLVTSDGAYDSACSLFVPRPDNAAGDPRTPLECSCVLVGEQVILTAANCLSLNVEESDPPLTTGIIVKFSDGGEQYDVTEIALHRHYDSLETAVDGLSGVGFTEFAMGHLDRSPRVEEGIVPAVVNTENLTTNFETAGRVAIVGFGAFSGAGSEFGTKRGLEASVRNLKYTHFFAGSMEATTCPGDGGAPVFDTTSKKLLAISQFDSLDRCFENLNRMRVDHVAAEFILPYVARYQHEEMGVAAVCGGDGVCAMASDNCPFTDLDCDPCDFQGGGAADCDASCSPRDFDCELGSLPGFECEADADCEFGGKCVAAEDDATFKYCTSNCDSAGLTAPTNCSNSLECVSADAGEECQYGTPSRGSQGFACNDNVECRSDICEGQICVFSCTSEADCTGGTTCLPSEVAPGTNVCRFAGDSGGGGFCAIEAPGKSGSGHGPFGFALFALLAAVFAFGQRRR